MVKRKATQKKSKSQGNSKKQTPIISIIIILGVLAISLLIIFKPQVSTDEKVVQCIGKNSILYTQTGCPHCVTQEKMFGENLKDLNRIDCIYEREKCSDIMGTPTWIIKDKKYSGVQSISKLKELTGC